MLLPSLFFVAAGNNVFAQQLTVTGTITDTKGVTIPAVSVQIKGTTTGTVADINGKYTIKASAGQVLTFKSIGYTDKEVTVGTSAVINVTLADANAQLNEVVVIGYGTQKRADVTGAVSGMKNENLDERAITRVDQALVGQLAGVDVKQTSGLPGRAFSINIRGAGSLSGGNEPLYVIDGFPLSVASPSGSGGFSAGSNPLDNLNPNDIESIQILKDAASAAIYGSRASNGVVLITTKHGQTGKPKISYNGYAGYNAASKYLQMLTGPQWIQRATEMINAAYVLKFGASGATANDDAATRTAMNAGAFSTAYQLDPAWSQAGYPGLEFVDWQKAIERNGLMQNHELSASGGTDNVKYFISGNYANQDGFIINTGFKNYNARANVETQVSKNLKLGLNLAPSYSISEDPGVEGKDNIFHQALSMTPVQLASSGLYANTFNNPQYSWSNTTNSPVAKLQNKIGESKVYRTLATIYAEYQIIKGLNFRSSINFDNADNTTASYTPYTVSGTLANRTFDPASNTNLYANTSGSYTTFRKQTFVNENTLTYNVTLNHDHDLTVLLGQSYNTDRLYNSSLSSSGGYTNGVIQTLNAAAATTGSSTDTKDVLVSYFSRVQYSYKSKYLLSASIREDGSSRFGMNTKYGVFPSASAGWRITEESFMKKMPVISDLKLRASFGINGNNNIGNYASIATLGSYGYVLGATQVLATGSAPNVLADPNLQWEKSKTYDLGLDFGLFANRLTGSFEYYNKLNSDLLFSTPIPETSGFSSYLTNAASVRNTGVELELTSRNLTGKFQWSTTVNISHDANKVVSLYGNQDQIIIPNAYDVSDAILKVGYPINSIYVVKQNGFLSAADIANHAATYGTGETVGDPKYVDLNGDGVITEADKQIVGHPNPNITWGVNNTFRYKGFDLSVLVQGQNGGSIYSQLGRAITRTGQGYTDNAPYFYNSRWESPTDQGAGRVSKAYSTFGFVANTDWLYSSDYYRIRDITLGYNLKNLVKSNKVFSAFRVYATAENFFGHDKYYGGLNPQAQNTTITSSGSLPEAGDYGGLPLAKSLIFGVNVTF